MISFTINVKNEIASFDSVKNENMAMLSAIIRNSGKIDKDITITTENSKVARRVYTLISDIYNVPVSIIDKNNNFNRNRLYIITVTDNIDFILNDLGILNGNKYLKTVPEYLIDSDDEKRAYLKGIFMACGSVNDPKTSRYHLEFFIDTEEEANFVND